MCVSAQPLSSSLHRARSIVRLVTCPCAARSKPFFCVLVIVDDANGERFPRSLFPVSYSVSRVRSNHLGVSRSRRQRLAPLEAATLIGDADHVLERPPLVRVDMVLPPEQSGPRTEMSALNPLTALISALRYLKGSRMVVCACRSLRVEAGTVPGTVVWRLARRGRAVSRCWLSGARARCAYGEPAAGAASRERGGRAGSGRAGFGRECGRGAARLRQQQQ